MPSSWTFQFPTRITQAARFLLACVLAVVITTDGISSEKEAVPPKTEVKKDPPKAEEENTDSEEDDDDDDDDDEDVLDLTNLSIEEIMNIEVSLVSRGKGQTLFNAPAAIHVITGEDIRRTGHQQLPEMLRLVPGMHVAKIDANKWAIAARGFNFRFNRFQLVQMDGRSLYAPSFSGMQWVAHDTVIEDIKQIEVIRGPGATLWGANAVNGIINFETKNSKDTQGLLVSALGGTEERAIGTVRYGGKITEDLYFKVYGKHTEVDESEPDGPEYTDDWNRSQAGFRFDWDGDSNKVTWQGDLYRAKAGNVSLRPDFTTGTLTNEKDDEEYNGRNFLARWTHTFSDTNEMEIQGYYDYVHVADPADGVAIRSVLTTYDLDYQQNMSVGDRHQLVWGANFRSVDFEFENGGIFLADPSGKTYQSYSGFVQDTISVIPDKLTAIIGTKLEYNAFTEFEYQPSARLVYTPTKKHILWWAVSRALRVPAPSDDISQVVRPVFPGVNVTIKPNHDLDAEEVISFEFGHRMKPVDWFSMDVTVFHNRYDNLIGNFLQNQLPPLIVRKNTETAKSYGLEASANWRIGDKIRMSATYTWLDLQITGDFAGEEHFSPTNMFHIRGYFDITDYFEINSAIYYNDTVSGQQVQAYWRGDLGITWRPPVDNLEVSVWGTNLFDSSHKEYGPDGFLSNGSSRVERGVFAKVTWKF